MPRGAVTDAVDVRPDAASLRTTPPADPRRGSGPRAAPWPASAAPTPRDALRGEPAGDGADLPFVLVERVMPPRDADALLEDLRGGDDVGPGRVVDRGRGEEGPEAHRRVRDARRGCPSGGAPNGGPRRRRRRRGGWRRVRACPRRECASPPSAHPPRSPPRSAPSRRDTSRMTRRTNGRRRTPSPTLSRRSDRVGPHADQLTSLAAARHSRPVAGRDEVARLVSAGRETGRTPIGRGRLGTSRCSQLARGDAPAVSGAVDARDREGGRGRREGEGEFDVQAEGAGLGRSSADVRVRQEVRVEDAAGGRAGSRVCATYS